MMSKLWHYWYTLLDFIHLALQELSLKSSIPIAHGTPWKQFPFRTVGMGTYGGKIRWKELTYLPSKIIRGWVFRRDYGKRMWNKVESSLHEVFCLWCLCFLLMLIIPIVERAMLLEAESDNWKSLCVEMSWAGNPELILTWSITSCVSLVKPF